MNPSFCNRLPVLDESEQVPSDSAVRTLLRGSDSATHGTGRNAVEYLNVAQSLKELGYWRTALTYHAMGTKSDETYCLLLEQDGFARETHAILSFAKSNPRHAMGPLMLAHNPEQKTWFTIGTGKDGTRDVTARFGNQEVVVYREQSTHVSSGILPAVDRWFDLSFAELCDLGQRSRQRTALPPHEHPGGCQLDLFAQHSGH